MNSIIRKISIGADYKNEAMHYSVGQSVYGGHTINNITLKNDEVMPWKKFNSNMAISVEYDLEY
jgi:hypothetical protein